MTFFACSATAILQHGSVKDTIEFATRIERTATLNNSEKTKGNNGIHEAGAATARLGSLALRFTLSLRADDVQNRIR